jgi:hypothetical protein
VKSEETSEKAARECKGKKENEVEMKQRRTRLKGNRRRKEGRERKVKQGEESAEEVWKVDKTSRKNGKNKRGRSRRTQ